MSDSGFPACTGVGQTGLKISGSQLSSLRRWYEVRLRQRRVTRQLRYFDKGSFLRCRRTQHFFEARRGRTANPPCEHKNV